MTSTKLRLSIMMFLQFFMWGAWYATLGTYLGKAVSADGVRLFSDPFIGDAYGTSAIAAIIAPFLVGLIADRYFAAERVLCVLHLIGAGTLWMASQSLTPTMFYMYVLAHFLCFMPTLSVANSLTMKNLAYPGKEFASIRVLGTIGWIVAGLMIGSLVLYNGQLMALPFEFYGKDRPADYMSIEPTAYPLMIAAISELVLAFFCLFLPHTPPSAAGQKVTIRDILGLDAIAIIKEPSVLVFVISSVLICIPLQFYYGLANPFMNEIGISSPASKMTLGQGSEIFFLLLLPFFFKTVGVRWILLVGMMAWVARYTAFAYGDAGSKQYLIYIGILLHGVCYDFFFVAGQVYMDSKAPAHLRNSVQGFLTFLTYGLGMFAGSVMLGRVLEHYATPDAAIKHNWTSVWLVPAGLAAAVLVFFALAFREEKAPVPMELTTEGGAEPVPA